MNRYSFETDEQIAHLLSHFPRERESPFYREPHFERKLKISNARASEMRTRFQSPHYLVKEFNFLKHRELKEIYKRARLTHRQCQVVNMRASGYTFDEIGQFFQHTKQGAQRIFTQALRKLHRAFNVYPYVGLGEVYRQELKRGTHS